MTEREQFEAYAAKHSLWLKEATSTSRSYESNAAEHHWRGWQARAEKAEATEAALQARGRELEEALQAYMKAGIYNSTDFVLQGEAHKKAFNALREQSPTIALQRRELDARIDEQTYHDCLMPSDRNRRLNELRRQRDELGGV